MRDYELTLVIDPDLTSEKQKKLVAKIKKEISDLKGKIEKTEEWGKKELAYPIKKKTLGYYFFIETELPEKAPTEIEKKIKLDEGIIRYLLVKSEGGKKPSFVKTSEGKGGEHGPKIA